MTLTKITITAALVGTAILAIGAGAYAGDKGGGPITTMSTPPLVPEGNSRLDCYIINVSPEPRYVRIEALDRDGLIVAEWGERLNPSTEAVAIAESSLKPRSCRFTVQGFSQHFRASGLVHVPGFGSVSALAAH